MFSKTIFYFFLFFFIASCHSSKKIGQSNKTKSIVLDKYSKILGTKVSHLALYEKIDYWMGKPYKYGGNDERGIDCSGLVNQLMNQVYHRPINANSQRLYEIAKKINPNELKEGDLIFFKIDSKNVSHVGFYLANRKFIHSTTHAGVMINTIDEAYYKKYFFSVGRL